MGDTATKVEAEATRLFAERGYAGTSVRAICEAAGANVNAVSYHFGGKQALYQRILTRFGEDRQEATQSILARPPRDAADLEARLLLFTESTLEAYQADPERLIIAFNEWIQGFRNCDGTETRAAILRENQVLLSFLEAARRRKLLRKGVDPAIVAGALFERITNHVRYADVIEVVYDTPISTPAYRRHWTEQVVGLLLYGAARRPEE